MILFRNDLKEIREINQYELDHIIPQEVPQLYRCDLDFAKENSGDKFRYILGVFEDVITYAHQDEFKYISIDSRTHMLMKDMHPAIPGWHCDDFYRPDDHNGQPDLMCVMKKAPSVHYMVLIGDVSKTQFLDEDLDLPLQSHLPVSNRPDYAVYDELINEKKPKIYECQPNILYRFGPLAFHRAMPATKNGWRSFIRMTLSNHREPKNQIRFQSNVYLEKGTSW